MLGVAQSILITFGANSNQYEQGNFREKEGKQIEWRSTQMNMVICLLGSVPKNLVPVEETTKVGCIPILSLSQSITQTGRVLFLNLMGH
jgi:hypothetical protein